MSGVTWSIRVGPTKKPSVVARRPSTPRPSTTTVAPCLLARRRSSPTIRSRAAAVTTGPISLAASRPGADAGRRGPCRRPCRPARRPTAPTATTAEIAMQRSPAEPKAGRDQVVGGEVEVGVRAARPRGSWRRRAPAPACRCRLALLVDVLARSGWSRRRRPRRRPGARGARRRPPCRRAATLKTPSGRPASAHSSAIRIGGADGSRSLGLSTNVLPQAIATGCIHIGTMTGKLNGVMPAHDAERLAERVRVDAGGDLVGVLALEQLRDAAGELDDLAARAAPRPRRRREHLAVLVGDRLGEPARRCALTSSRKANSTLVRALSDVCDQSSKAVAGGGHGGVDVRRRSASSDLAPAARRWPGSRRRPAPLPTCRWSPCRRSSARWSSSVVASSLSLVGAAVGRGQVGALRAPCALVRRPGALRWCPAPRPRPPGRPTTPGCRARAPAGRSRRGSPSCAVGSPAPRPAPSRSSSTSVARITSAPRLAALAARSTGQHVAVEAGRRCGSGSGCRSAASPATPTARRWRRSRGSAPAPRSA